MTTPIQLKASVACPSSLGFVDYIVSATAPMSAEMAMQTERVSSARLYEIYGFTEAGSIATRRPTIEEQWHLLFGYQLMPTEQDSVRVLSGYVKEEIPDRIRIISSHAFEFLGRASDLLKVGGKRYSSKALVAAIEKIEGVEDAVVFVPNERSSGGPSALVVGGVDAKMLRKLLSREVEASFVPRPIICVDEIPRNSIGKIDNKKLNEIYLSHTKV